MKFSKLGGAALGSPDMAGPLCRHCGKPLKLLVQIDFTELPQQHLLPEELSGKVLQSFICDSDECIYLNVSAGINRIWLLDRESCTGSLKTASPLKETEIRGWDLVSEPLVLEDSEAVLDAYRELVDRGYSSGRSLKVLGGISLSIQVDPNLWKAIMGRCLGFIGGALFRAGFVGWAKRSVPIIFRFYVRNRAF